MIAGATRKRDSAVTKNDIIAASIALFASHGFAKTTTKQIAVRAGVSEALIYHHFGNKLSVLRALTKGKAAFTVQIERRLADNALSPEENLMALATDIERYLSSRKDHTKILWVLITEARSDPALEQYLVELISGIERQMRDYLARFAWQKVESTDEPETVIAHAFILQVLGYYTAHFAKIHLFDAGSNVGLRATVAGLFQCYGKPLPR